MLMSRVKYLLVIGCGHYVAKREEKMTAVEKPSDVFREVYKVLRLCQSYTISLKRWQILLAISHIVII